MTYQGVVKGNVVIIKRGVRLQEGQVAKILVPEQNPLLRFAGILSRKDAEIMQKEIRRTRRSSMREITF